jgi:hypothetical protein
MVIMYLGTLDLADSTVHGTHTPLLRRIAAAALQTIVSYHFDFSIFFLDSEPFRMKTRPNPAPFSFYSRPTYFVSTRLSSSSNWYEFIYCCFSKNVKIMYKNPSVAPESLFCYVPFYPVQCALLTSKSLGLSLLARFRYPRAWLYFVLAVPLDFADEPTLLSCPLDRLTNQPF